MMDPSTKETTGFEKSATQESEQNNAFVSTAINQTVDPDAVYNTVPFYAKLPAILVILLFCAPLGLFLLWKFQRKHLMLPILITTLYVVCLLRSGFQYYDLISTLFSLFF